MHNRLILGVEAQLGELLLKLTPSPMPRPAPRRKLGVAAENIMADVVEGNICKGQRDGAKNWTAPSLTAPLRDRTDASGRRRDWCVPNCCGS